MDSFSMRMTGPSGVHTFLAAGTGMTATQSNKNNGRGIRILVADGWHRFIGPLKVQGNGQHLLFLFSQNLFAVDPRKGRKLVRICVYIYCVFVRRRRASENRLPGAFASAARLVHMRRWIWGRSMVEGSERRPVRFVVRGRENVWWFTTTLELRGMWRGRFGGRHGNSQEAREG
jgi:hypothetical protein